MKTIKLFLALVFFLSGLLPLAGCAGNIVQPGIGPIRGGGASQPDPTPTPEPK